MANFYRSKDGKGIVTELGMPTDVLKIGGYELLNANTVDASVEKHVPAVSLKDDLVNIQVGSALHPATEEHHIEWIFVQTSFGGSFYNIEVGDPPSVLMHLVPEEVQEVYAYCNLHGLWKAPTPIFDVSFDQNTTACSPEFTEGCVDPSSEH